jgi:hypothetical protein
MSPSYFLLNRVPGMGIRTLLSAKPEALKSARQSLKFLLAFMDILGLFAVTIYAKRKASEMLEDWSELGQV